MTENVELKISVDALADAADALNTLADAAERAKKAIDALNGAAHGGVNVKIVGQIATCEVLPAVGAAAGDHWDKLRQYVAR